MIDPRTNEGARLAAAEIAARAEIKRCFALVRDRHDVGHPATLAWNDAIARWRLALDRIYPEEFWAAIAELKQARSWDAEADRWAWSRAPFSSIEVAIRFLEADLICFRSGYVKQRLIRHLVRQPLSDDALRRLRGVAVSSLSRPTRRGFRAVCRLAARVRDEELLIQIDNVVASDDAAAARRAGWMRTAILTGKLDGQARQWQSAP